MTFYCNFGMPKCATTFIYRNLLNHPDVDYVGDKEMLKFWQHDFINFDEYIKEKLKYKVTLDFTTNIWAMDNEQLLKLKPYVTHSSFIIREIMYL